MARRSSEAWWQQHWGHPCKLHDPAPVTIGGHQFRTDGRMVAAWEAFAIIIDRHNYDVHPPYPEGDSGMYNCRHIGGNPDRPMSAHAWAGAIDINWQTNPDGSRLVTDMPQALRDDLHGLRTKSGAPLFRWGGDWDRDPRTGHSYYDAMHWEIVASPAEIASGINGFPKDQEDPMADPRGVCRLAMREFLGRSPADYPELDWHVGRLDALGLNGYIEWLESSPEAKAWAAKIGAEVRTPDTA